MAAQTAEELLVGDEEVEVAADPATKKKKKNKKKSAAGAAEAAEAVEEAPEEAPVAAQAAPAAESGDEAEEAGEGQDGVKLTAGQKKNLKKKAKAKAAAEAAASAAAAPEAPEAAAEDDEEEDDEAGDGEGEGDAEGGQKKKKKTKRSKKKTKTVDDEAFEKWCQATLEATKSDTERMDKAELMKPPKAFWGFNYSGDLRPAYVAAQMKMPADILKPDYALDPQGVSMCERTGMKEVPILEGEKLEIMKEACRLGREVIDTAARFMKAGVTGDQIDRIVYQACVDRKIYPSPLNYYRFPKSVCVSPNEVICHGIPDARPIEEGDIVNLDISIYHKGFHSDLNETFFIGQCGEESQRLVRTAYNALHAAAAMIKPGTFYRDLGNAIHQEAVKTNCSVVTTYCGHGVGELFHGPPKVPHYRKNKAVGVMKPGHVFTIEPMINLGGNGGDRTWPDDWTAVTKDGKRSAQFEHTFLVTEQGYEVLTARVGTDRSCMPQYDPAMFQR